MDIKGESFVDQVKRLDRRYQKLLRIIIGMRD